MPQQNFGQQLLHTERSSSNPTVQQIKEESANIINSLHEQKEQATNLKQKRWLSKSIMHIENAATYAERAFATGGKPSVRQREQV